MTAMTATPLTEEQKNDILRWSQNIVDNISDAELSDDWWGAYNDEWDVNIWWDYFCYYATAYRYNEGTVDTKNFVACGSLMPVWRMNDHSCSICGDPMGRDKGENSKPYRLPSGDEFAHYICATEAGL